MTKKNKIKKPAIDLSVDEELLEVATVKQKAAKIFYRLLTAEQMTAKELAEKLGWSPPRVSKILKGGENLTLETMIKILGVFGRTLDLSVKALDREPGVNTRFPEMNKRRG